MVQRLNGEEVIDQVTVSPIKYWPLLAEDIEQRKKAVEILFEHPIDISDWKYRLAARSFGYALISKNREADGSALLKIVGMRG